jgi:hypothetical protein
MPYTTYYGPNTSVSEACLWIAEGSRRICVTYNYFTSSGLLTYAASVFRCKKPTWAMVHDTNIYIEPEISQMMAHENTTTRRFEIRPVVTVVSPDLPYDDIIKSIRREMCHGYGCKGPRRLPSAFGFDCASSDGGSESSANTWLSDEEHLDDGDQYVPVDIHKLERKTVRRLRYISTTTHELYKGERTMVMREFFIVFKADKNTGELIYGAAICRRPESSGPLTDKELIENHYKTAMARLEQHPVEMVIADELLHQLKKNATHREDVMYEIVDKINERQGGRLQVRQYDW